MPPFAKLVSVPVYAGFPSPAEEYFEKAIDLNDELIRNPPATFFMRVKGDSMIGACIHDGDILLVDRSRTAVADNIVVATMNGGFTVKTLVQKADGMYLKGAQKDSLSIPVRESEQVSIWGVVSYVIHKT